MSEVQYPFIDLAVHERVREAFAAGMAVAIFTPELRTVCWANGRGAQLFGFSSIYDLLEQGADRSDLMFRQVEPIARSLQAVGDRRTFTIRIASGFSRIAVQASCEMIRFQGKTCIMLALAADNRKLSLAERAARLIEGFDDPETHMAVLDGDGGILASSGEFAGLNISSQTARMLVSMVGNDRNRLIKRPISTASGYLPAAIGTVSDDPALHLLFVVGMARTRSAVTVVAPVAAAGAAQPFADVPAEPVVEDDLRSDYEDALNAVAAIEENPEAEEEISLDGMPSDAESDWQFDDTLDAPVAGEANDTAAETVDATEEAEAVDDDPSEHDALGDDETDDAAMVSSETEVSETAAPLEELVPEYAAAEEHVEQADAEEDEAEDTSSEADDDQLVSADAGGDADPIQEVATEVSATEQIAEAAIASDQLAPAEELAEAAVSEQPDVRQMRAVRFVWKIDASGHFSEISKEFAEAVGPHAADIAGMAFSDLAALFNLDPDGKIGELLGKRDTWSGKTIWWPVEGTSLVVPVDLAALPTYTRTREFDGFRGFGIVRLADAAEDPNAAGLSLGSAPVDKAVSSVPLAGAEAAESGTAALEQDEYRDEEIRGEAEERDTAGDHLGKDEAIASDDPVPAFASNENDAASSGNADVSDEDDEVSSDEWPVGEKPALRLVETPAREHSDKVIQLEERRSRLSPGEQAAFHEIGRRLDTIARPSDEAEGEDAKKVENSPSAGFGEETERSEDDAISPSGQDDGAGNRDDLADEVQSGDIELPSPAGEDPIAATGDDEAQQRQAAEEQAEDELSDDAPAGMTAEEATAQAIAEGAAADDEMTGDERSIEPEATEADDLSSVSGDMHDTAVPEEADDAEAEEPVAETQGEVPVEEPARSVEAEAYALMLSGRERTGLSAEIVDQMPVALLVHAGDVLIHANPEFLTLTGYASLEALSDVGGLDALLQRQELEGRGAEAGSMVVVRADDAIVPVTARLQSIRWNDAAALMLALMPVATPEAVDTDETEVDVVPLNALRAADQLVKLQVEVEELRAILETATDGVVIIGSGGEVRSMNRAASALFNFDGEEINGQPFVTLFAHESQRAVVDYLGGLSGTGVASVLNDGREVIGREASGGFIPLFMTIGRLTSSNGFCAVIRDITQWKRTEDELRAAKRAAETANAHKSEFLAHVSHEIRTPLNAIIGFADMMGSERLGPVGHPRYVEYANDIGRSGRHVLDIVNDLLDISKIEAGELDLDFSAVGLNETVSEAVSLVQPQANGQRVIIRTALSQSVPQVVADLRSIKQIVLNILSNAIRFTPSGGQIVVSTGYEANGSVVLRIRDTGIGMSRAELELAMKPFRQVPGASRNRGDGTGLGLPLTKAMVDANRASFNITSAPNEGTLVEVTFPSQRVLAS
ncbi:PAS domain S-box-containing protein [Rhizobium sp. NFR07]|uniref:ATP-binding protein n=1 Tax=Rhizobium sp. NFR07 TaxID=1566262 RepID=UPI0008E24CF1|nr:ATP-binding protein [Rhizobium sp. NFR07]SFB09518.1 PAS domain S-box-containing protein [Rhizobium sp. NFR07]